MKLFGILSFLLFLNVFYKVEGSGSENEIAKALGRLNISENTDNENTYRDDEENDEENKTEEGVEQREEGYIKDFKPIRRGRYTPERTLYRRKTLDHFKRMEQAGGSGGGSEVPETAKNLESNLQEKEGIKIQDKETGKEMKKGGGSYATITRRERRNKLGKCIEQQNGKLHRGGSSTRQHTMGDYNQPHIMPQQQCSSNFVPVYGPPAVYPPAVYHPQVLNPTTVAFHPAYQQQISRVSGGPMPINPIPGHRNHLISMKNK
uniref:Uncharacterized protein n=1 Tax=Meloidogyne hapla TaxID=6305 RepID=A0A1I8C3G8_MELHA